MARSRKPRKDPIDERPPLSLADLERAFLEVKQLRHVTRDLSPEEKQLRKDIRCTIKALDRQIKLRHDPTKVKHARRARQMLNELDGVAVSRGSVADEHLSKVWNETRDYGKPRSRPAKFGRVRSVVSGGAPGLGNRR